MKHAMVLRFLLSLLFVVCVRTALFPALAAEPCPPVEGRFTGANPFFKSGQELPREGTFSLALQPGETVDYLVGSRRVKGEAGYGGVVTLRKLWAGRYRLFLSSAADLELIQNYTALTLTECRGEEASYLVTVGEGLVLLQVRGASAAVIDIAFLKL
jgi:hypothetical protein